MKSIWMRVAKLMECYDAEILIVKYSLCLQNMQPHLFSGVIAFFFKQITTTSDWSFCGVCCVISLTRESHSRSVHHVYMLERNIIINRHYTEL